MKKLRVTVNGRMYDVVVEVLEDDEQHVPGATTLGPGTAAPERLAPPAARAPAPSPAALANVKAKNPDAVLAPIAGTVQKVYVSAGTKIEEKAPLVLLDAMKMDTYIYAPKTGTIAEVKVNSGDTVQVGDLLVRYQPEG